MRLYHSHQIDKGEQQVSAAIPGFSNTEGC